MIVGGTVMDVVKRNLRHLIFHKHIHVKIYNVYLRSHLESDHPPPPLPTRELLTAKGRSDSVKT